MHCTRGHSYYLTGGAGDGEQRNGTAGDKRDGLSGRTRFTGKGDQHCRDDGSEQSKEKCAHRSAASCGATPRKGGEHGARGEEAGANGEHGSDEEPCDHPNGGGGEVIVWHK